MGDPGPSTRTPGAHRVPGVCPGEEQEPSFCRAARGRTGPYKLLLLQALSLTWAQVTKRQSLASLPSFCICLLCSEPFCPWPSWTPGRTGLIAKCPVTRVEAAPGEQWLLTARPRPANPDKVTKFDRDWFTVHASWPFPAQPGDRVYSNMDSGLTEQGCHLFLLVRVFD